MAMFENNPYTNPYANPYANPYSNPYGNPYGATMDSQGSGDDEGGTNIDIMEWVVRILHYWYLFVIGLAIAFSLAMLKNRKWIAAYYSYGTIIIKQSGGYGANLMQGFRIDEGMNDINNQVLRLRSHDLISRTVDSIPFLNVEYITMGRFKTRNLYRQTPFTVETIDISERAYDLLFRLDIQEGELRISLDDDDDRLQQFEVNTHYGEKFETPYFSGIIWPTALMTNKGRLYFRLRSRQSLISEFQSRLQLNFLHFFFFLLGA